MAVHTANISKAFARLSLESVGTVIPTVGRIDLSFSELCEYIHAHNNLSRAEIVTLECYAENIGTVTHRFLLARLRRPGRKDAYIRLERQRGENISAFRLLRQSGVTPANDTVRILFFNVGDEEYHVRR